MHTFHICSNLIVHTYGDLHYKPSSCLCVLALPNVADEIQDHKTQINPEANECKEAKQVRTI